MLSHYCNKIKQMQIFAWFYSEYQTGNIKLLRECANRVWNIKCVRRQCFIKVSDAVPWVILQCDCVINELISTLEY